MLRITLLLPPSEHSKNIPKKYFFITLRSKQKAAPKLPWIFTSLNNIKYQKTWIFMKAKMTSNLAIWISLLKQVIGILCTVGFPKWYSVEPRSSVTWKWGFNKNIPLTYGKWYYKLCLKVFSFLKKFSFCSDVSEWVQH